jgi:outer membrane protein
MNVYNRLTLVFTFLLVIPAHYSQQKLTLDNVLTIALNRNTDVVKLTNTIRTYESGVKASYGTLLPTLDVSYSWNWQKVRDAGGKTQIDYFGNETILGASETDTRNNSFKVGGSVTLFDGLASFAGVRQSENSLESAKLQLEKYKQDVCVLAATYFYTVISTEKMMDINSENIKYNKSLLDEVKERNRLGMVSVVDVYMQEAQVANADLLFIQSQAEYEKAKINLLNFLALDVTAEYTYSAESSYPIDSSIHHRDPSELYSEALSNRVDYKSVQLIVDNSYEQLSVARSGMYPSLSGSYSFGTSAVKVENLFTRKTYGVGLSLNIPVFSNWSTENDIEAALVAVDNSKEDYIALERQIKSEVKTGYTDLSAAKTSIDAARKSVMALEQNARLQKERYQLGTVPLTEVLLSNRDFVQASQSLVSAELNYMISYFTFLNYMGKLDIKT